MVRWLGLKKLKTENNGSLTRPRPTVQELFLDAAGGRTRISFATGMIHAFDTFLEELTMSRSQREGKIIQQYSTH